MKFSVLLPTRNRLELLKFAVESVIRQDYSNWEVIVSDNYSIEDISGYVKSIGDPRIKYCRTQDFVPVTENWNYALKKSSGDYVIMLGDDDCLMKGCLKTIKNLIETYESPDFIYSNAFLYAYPEAVPGFPKGFLQLYGNSSLFNSTGKPYWLDKEQAMSLVNYSMNFKMFITYNMQHSIINRRFIDKLQYKGEFFQSPYPDFYATNVMMLKSERILICPYPIVTVGISRKSFGFYFFNNNENQGVEFLNNLSASEKNIGLEQVILPGSKDKTSWLIAMETIRINYGSEFELIVNYKRYRYLQILHVYKKYCLNMIESRLLLSNLTKMMSFQETLLYTPLLWVSIFMIKLIPHNKHIQFTKFISKIFAIIHKTPQNEFKVGESYYNNILEVFEKVDPLNDFRVNQVHR